jgi:hypothetical protein
LVVQFNELFLLQKGDFYFRWGCIDNQFFIHADLVL